jgi:SAM-dependent methyltransferase
VESLREEVAREYAQVAQFPELGFHFHTGRRLADLLDYKPEWLENLPDKAVESFAGTGNPFSLGEIKAGERVLDVGCGAGLDCLIAAKMAGPGGEVIGFDMTMEMIEKARKNAAAAGIKNVSFEQGYSEELSVPDEWADVVISNGAINLSPDKDRVYAEMVRVLKPGGRIQIADIVVQKPVPDSAKRKIDLWAG